jgi:hypothetical protein
MVEAGTLGITASSASLHLSDAASPIPFYHPTRDVSEFEMLHR